MSQFDDSKLDLKLLFRGDNSEKVSDGSEIVSSTKTHKLHIYTNKKKQVVLRLHELDNLTDPRIVSMPEYPPENDKGPLPFGTPRQGKGGPHMYFVGARQFGRDTHIYRATLFLGGKNKDIRVTREIVGAG